MIQLEFFFRVMCKLSMSKLFALIVWIVGRMYHGTDFPVRTKGHVLFGYSLAT